MLSRAYWPRSIESLEVRHDHARSNTCRRDADACLLRDRTNERSMSSVLVGHISELWQSVSARSVMLGQHLPLWLLWSVQREPRAVRVDIRGSGSGLSGDPGDPSGSQWSLLLSLDQPALCDPGFCRTGPEPARLHS